jgi:hypothetical protein
MRPVTVTVGPLGSASANNIATSQTPAGTTGSATATFTASSASITATNSFVAGQIVTFSVTNGSLPANLTPGSPYYVISSGLSSSAFEVAGTFNGTAITMIGAGSGTATVYYGANVALNGTLVNASGVAVLDVPRRVLITTSDTTHTFTVTGTSASGTIQSEIVGPITTSGYTKLDYATVTSITVSGGLSAAMTAGTNAIASTPWVRFDEYALPQVTVAVDISGTANVSVQQTLDDPNSNFGTPILPANVTWISSSDANAVNVTASFVSYFAYAPTFARVLLNSGNGTVTATFTQLGVAPY